MTNIQKPLLAGKASDLSKINYPVIVSPKLDGIRCLIINGQAVSRTFKQIPNKFIAKELPTLVPNGFDGELVLAGGQAFNEVSSAVMRFDGEPNYEYQVFDYVKDNNLKAYVARLEDLEKAFPNNIRIKLVPTRLVNNEQELIEAEEKAVLEGYEGLMIRSLDGKYKFGRSSEKEGILLKLKRWEDSEAEILGFEEKNKNTNIKEKDNFGNSKRSHKKEGMQKAGTLGKFIVKDIKTKAEFSCGSGLNDAMRNEIWANKEKYIGKLIKYKYQPHGVVDLPRLPIFLGFRSRDDM